MTQFILVLEVTLRAAAAVPEELTVNPGGIY